MLTYLGLYSVFTRWVCVLVLCGDVFALCLLFTCNGAPKDYRGLTGGDFGKVFNLIFCKLVVCDGQLDYPSKRETASNQHSHFCL